MAKRVKTKFVDQDFNVPVCARDGAAINKGIRKNGFKVALLVKSPAKKGEHFNCPACLEDFDGAE
jgi:hypothetical protein